MNMTNLSNFATMDVYILLSAVNMQLRDEFDSLESLCSCYEIDKNALIEKLKSAGFEYVAQQNQFK